MRLLNTLLSNDLRNGLQLTLAIIKPHAVKAPHAVQDIRETIRNNGFLILKTERILLPQEVAEKFYAEHTGKFFYDRLVTFMTSGCIDVHILAKEDAIQHWRKLMGPTKVFQTQFTDPESIRGRHGLTDTRNAAHGSDSVESAAKEISFFFPHFNIEDSISKLKFPIEPQLINFDEDKFQHIL